MILSFASSPRAHSALLRTRLSQYAPPREESQHAFLGAERVGDAALAAPRLEVETSAGRNAIHLHVADT